MSGTELCMNKDTTLDIRLFITVSTGLCEAMNRTGIINLS